MSHLLLIISALLYILGLLSLTFWSRRRPMGHHLLFFGLFALAHGLWLFVPGAVMVRSAFWFPRRSRTG